MNLHGRMLTPPEGAIRVYSQEEIDGFACAIADQIRTRVGESDPSNVKLLGVMPEGVFLMSEVLSLLGDILTTEEQYDTVTFKNRQLPGTRSHAIDPRGTSLPPVSKKRVHLLLARERSGFSREHLKDLALAAGAASVHTSVMIHQPTNGREGPDFAAQIIEDPRIRLFGYGIPLLGHEDLGYKSDYANLPEIHILPRDQANAPA